MDAESPAKRRKIIKTPMPTPEEKFAGKLHHATKEIKKAGKTARMREIQRLVRKIKDTRAKTEQKQELTILEQQLEDLKTIDCEMVASSMLLRRLSKDAALQNESCVQILEKELEDVASWDAKHHSKPQSSSKALSENRLRSSKFLAGQVSSVVASLVSVLQPSESREKQVVTSGPVENVDMAEQDEWSSGSIDDDHTRPIVGNLHRSKIPDDSSEAESDAESEAEDTQSESEEILDRDLSQDQDDLKSEPLTGQSSFLPSLAVGYISGDSEASDMEQGKNGKKSKGGIDIAPRKNRRGQRARMAIWEKKYGKNANHLKREREAQKDGSMPRKGSLKPPFLAWKGPKRTRSDQPSTTPQRHPRPATDTPSRRKAQKTDAVIHPSWEAARKKKLQPMVLPPMGKKIVF